MEIVDFLVPQEKQKNSFSTLFWWAWNAWKLLDSDAEFPCDTKNQINSMFLLLNQKLTNNWILRICQGSSPDMEELSHDARWIYQNWKNNLDKTKGTQKLSTIWTRRVTDSQQVIRHLKRQCQYIYYILRFSNIQRKAVFFKNGQLPVDTSELYKMGLVII